MKGLIPQDAEAIRRIKAELAKRGWLPKDLARETGMARGTIYNVLAGQNRFWPPRAAINAALGREFFSKPGSQAFAVSADKVLRTGDLATKAGEPVLVIWTVEERDELIRDLWAIVGKHYEPKKKLKP